MIFLPAFASPGLGEAAAVDLQDAEAAAAAGLGVGLRAGLRAAEVLVDAFSTICRV